MAPFAPGKRRCLVLDGVSGICLAASWKKIVAIVCPTLFDTRLDKIYFSAAMINKSFKRYVKI